MHSYWSVVNKFWKISTYKPIRENKSLSIFIYTKNSLRKTCASIYKVIGFSIPTVRLSVLNHKVEYLL